MKSSRVFQYIVKIGILVFITYQAVMHQVKGVLVAPNAHVFCPFGGLESLYQLAATGGYIKKIMPATMVLLLASVLLAIVFNRAFCGWICPLGTLQTIFDKIARFLKIKKVTVPAKLEKLLSLVKYVILVAALYFTWRAGDLVYSAYDPWSAYAHIAAGFEELYSEMLIGSIFLVLALVGSLWMPNNFCRYFCPMGAFLSFFSRFSPSKITRDTSSCIRCKKCDRVCPAQLEISTVPEVKSGQCLSCGDCVAACPVPNTLDYNFAQKYTLNWLIYGVLTVIVFFTPVLIAKATGIWRVNFSDAQELLIDSSGVLNPYNAKGSLPLETMFQEFDVPKEAVFEHFNLPADTDASQMMKTIAEAHGFAAEDFKIFFAEYLQEQNPGLVFEVIEGHGTTEHEESGEEGATHEGGEESAAVPEGGAGQKTPVDVRGSTTLAKILEYGLTEEQFKEITGLDIPEDTSIILKDFAAENGLDRETIKDKIIETLQQ